MAVIKTPAFIMADLGQLPHTDSDESANRRTDTDELTPPTETPSPTIVPPAATPTPTPTQTPTSTPVPTATPTPNGGGAITLQISASTDDVNQVSNTLYTTDSTAWLGTGGSASSSYAGLRFTTVSIPKKCNDHLCQFTSLLSTITVAIHGHEYGGTCSR